MSVPDPSAVDWVPIYMPGLQGVPGAQGPAGAAGSQGPQGAQGAQGPQGPMKPMPILTPTNRSIQGGSAAGTADGNGGLWIGFEFATNPLAIICTNGDWGAGAFVCNVGQWSVSTVSFYVYCWNPTSGMMANLAVRVNWIVYGYN